MEMTVLKKKISTFKTDGGYLKNVSDELLMEILHAWESWPDTPKSFYAGLGVDHRKMASLMGKAKKLKREGHFPVSEFKEIKIEGGSSLSESSGAIELSWDSGKVIRFRQVEQLVDFLKKVA